jgi:iron-sulfur cluster repair protein YtfE (RIC family)
MKITDAFLGEHAVFYAQFTFLEETLPKTKDLALIKSHGSMLGIALVGHAQLEEELLFQKLEPFIGSGGPLAVMRSEHKQIEGGLVRLSDLETLEQTRTVLLHTINVARGHFAKEEQVLYPLAERTLEGYRNTELGEQWADQRQVFIVRKIQ